MLLLTGERITATHFRPSPMAVAMHLARLPRFGGGLRDDCDHWSVLHHSFLVARIALERLVKDAEANQFTRKSVELAALAHDATEVLISDIPRPGKTRDTKELERHLADQLVRAWGIPHQHFQKVKRADTLALLIEAKRVAVPGLLDLIIEESGLAEYPDEGNQYADYIERLLSYGDTVHRETANTRDALVSMYRNRVYHLLHALSDNRDSAERWGLPADPHGKMYP